jgi:acyl-CoA synthetase (AMP-forming)/AMP-acid ligase II
MRAPRHAEKYQVTALYPSFVTIMRLVYHPTFMTLTFARPADEQQFAVQPPGVAEPIMAAMPQALQVGSFGMTEAAGTVCTGGWDEAEARRITRLGRPLPGLEVRIVNPETGHDLKNGMRGEVFVRGYSLFEGYYKDAEKSAQALDADGWFHTGDIGSLDDDGRSCSTAAQDAWSVARTSRRLKQNPRRHPAAKPRRLSASQRSTRGTRSVRRTERAARPARRN